MTGFSPATRRALKKRSKGLCEGCGLNEATEAHHCQFRSRGGPDTLGNALHLCGRGNTSGCHGIAHAGYRGESMGWAIRSKHDPLLVPKFRTFDRTWWRFDDDGGKESMNPIDAVEYLVLINAIRQGMPT